MDNNFWGPFLKNLIKNISKNSTGLTTLNMYNADTTAHDAQDIISSSKREYMQISNIAQEKWESFNKMRLDFVPRFEEFADEFEKIQNRPARIINDKKNNVSFPIPISEYRSSANNLLNTINSFKTNIIFSINTSYFSLDNLQQNTNDTNFNDFQNTANYISSIVLNRLAAKEYCRAVDIRDQTNIIINSYQQFINSIDIIMDAFSKINTQYDLYFMKSQEIISQCTEFEHYSQHEISTLEITVSLLACLDTICKIDLAYKDDKNIIHINPDAMKKIQEKMTEANNKIQVNNCIID